MTLNDLQNQVSQLQSQKNQLVRQNEELCKKLSALEKTGKVPTLNTQDETFDIRNLPTGLSARSPSGGNQPGRESQGVLSVGAHTA